MHMHVHTEDVLPFIPWLRRYNRHYLKADLFAGLTVAVVALPQTMALITIAVFSLYCLLRLLALWRRYHLQGFSGWISVLPGMVGVVLLIVTAFYGGELVYHFGVNVAAVTP